MTIAQAEQVPDCINTFIALIPWIIIFLLLWILTYQ
jgi:hypothetical protein